MRHLEDSLQITIADHLRLYHPDVLWWHTPNGGKRNAREGARLKRMGVLAGVPDIILHWQINCETPQYGAIELKIGKGKQTDSQKEFQSRWGDFNGWYAIVRSLDELKKTLNDWRIFPVTKCPPGYAQGAIEAKRVKPSQKGNKPD